MTKQDVINELSRLYVLEREGLKVKSLIREMEQLLMDITDEEIDKEKEKKRKETQYGH